jgi:hypothetical protein
MKRIYKEELNSMVVCKVHYLDLVKYKTLSKHDFITHVYNNIIQEELA